MRKLPAIVLLAGCALCLAACQSPTASAGAEPVQKISPYAGAAQKSAPTYGGGDGTTPDQAVIIQGTTDERAGIGAEYAWIRQYYPGAKIEGQTLNMIKGKPHDIFSIKTPSGEAKKLYFDISAFFGKAFGL